MSPGFDLPDFPWDSLADAKALAKAHPDGFVDLSVGSPADPVASSARAALAAASDAHGYPATAGTGELRKAIVSAAARDFDLAVSDVLPVIGAKEAIAWLPLLLGAREGDTVVIPRLAYPTYEVAARLARAEAVRADHPDELPPLAKPPVLWFLNSPANPHGAVASPALLTEILAWTRANGTTLVSDECYLRFAWEGEAVSALHPSVAGDEPVGVIAVHSLSKIANLAGYRAGYIAGDSAVVRDLLGLRRHAGMIVPDPVQAAVAAALHDVVELDAQRERYLARRQALRPALEQAGFRVDHSEGGLYLWATREEPAEATVGWFAERGVLVAPGSFYGPDGERHVRVALTATDEDIAAVVRRLRSVSAADGLAR
ncbi:succinyldiaminopimelate transaminase [Segniliparus rugosus]|uniref:Aminotransferase n=1 Tax=Segniliparus rugosus (strain ATCC BAA-974 / DSM 45345 / CCUG 50838 / CIP 108380 / JCM 13579 / CDC 945) TaxID=679197 RepID=E5XM28_SEGRC|nr:succinyldiaminopimelate transaminase [Segniliparus rugosus]EFV14589.1 succinyldiaminopimelate transaminase [Segniliparus rugosus ATCC BAA-974]